MTSIHKATFKERTVINGFKLTGLVPFKPYLVLQQLNENQPPSPKPESEPEELVTPCNLQQFEDCDDIWNISNREGSEFEYTLEKTIKGAQAQAYRVQELEWDHAKTEAAQQALARREEFSRRHLPKGGIMKACNAQRMTRIQHELTEKEALEKLRLKWKKVMAQLKRYAHDHAIKVKPQRKNRKRKERDE